jgi:hydroxymethylglutaryl-CoA reductase (NADPH)
VTVPQFISREILAQIFSKESVEEVAKRLQPISPDEQPLSSNIPFPARWDKEAQEERLKVLSELGIKYEYLNGEKKFDAPAKLQGNIENYIGMAQIPIGVAGPLRIKGLYANGDFYVPLATTEGALVASYNRGAKIISMSGGAITACLTERVSRAPGFVFNSLIEVGKFLLWTVDKFDIFKKLAKTTTRYGVLEDMKVNIVGNQVILIFEYTTGDAAGQNMVTIATDAVYQYILENAPIKPVYHFLESNMSGDKKATMLSFLFVRGKKVTSEVIIPPKIVKSYLHTTPEMMMEYSKISAVGGIQSGSIGVHGHYANALAGIFIACGQDAACVSEASIGISRMDIVQNGALYMSVTLPNLIVGTVGGGTALPTQKECLQMLGCVGEGTSRKFAEICAATVLAGEISIIGALAAGDFAKAHQVYGRKKK